MEQAKKSEPYGYIIKPFEPRDLQIAIEIALHKHAADKTIRDIKERYQLLVCNVPGIVYTGYADGTADFLNEKVEHTTGYSRKEFESRSMKWTDIILEEDVEETKKAFIHALRTDKVYVRKYRIKKRTGEVIWIQERSHIVCNEDGKIKFVDGIFFDITHQVLTEEQIRRQSDQLQTAYHELHLLQQKKEHEYKLAQEIFSKAILANYHEHPNIKCLSSSMETVGGDILLFAPTLSGGLCALLGDFTGHGLR